MAKHGLIYIIHNDMHPTNVYKVGLTSNSIEERMSELNRETSNPGTFRACAYFPVSDVFEAETRCHDVLKKQGFEKGKEFFQASFQQILSVVEGVCSNYQPNSFVSNEYISPIGA